MMWCHLLLAIPVLGLGLFFMLPFTWALTIYLAIVLLSSWLYYKIMESIHAPIVTGAEALVGQLVATNADGSVRWRGEWWTTEPRLPNRRVQVVALHGLRLLVQPQPKMSPHQEPAE